jgi:uncharacterized membrane protein
MLWCALTSITTPPVIESGRPETASPPWRRRERRTLLRWRCSRRATPAEARRAASPAPASASGSRPVRRFCFATAASDGVVTAVVGSSGRCPCAWSNDVADASGRRGREHGQAVRLAAVPSAETSFVAVVFGTADAAEDAQRTVRQLDETKDVSIRDLAVVVRTESGRIELLQTREIAPAEGVIGVGTVGLVAGVLLGLPVGGALLGLVGGAFFGMRDTGIPDSRLRKLGADLQPGQAVLCVLVDAGGIEPTREALGRYGAVFEVELSSDSGG